MKRAIRRVSRSTSATMGDRAQSQSALRLVLSNVKTMSNPRCENLTRL